MNRWAALAAAGTMAAACGSAGTGSSPSPSPSPSPSLIATPPSTPSPAGLVFKLSGVGGATATGTITVTTQAGSLTVELNIAGLQSSSVHVSHIHIGSCAGRGAIKFALNPVVADSQGDALTKTTVMARYPPNSGTWYVVIHAGPDMSTSTNAKYLMCGNLFK